MIGILHWYILRELLKAFALTSIGLTLMFAMGGGLLNLIHIEQVSGSDVARMLLYFVPLVASFMLPIAALLSCALVYGRLAADNELDACKASGINILRLMGSAVGLALVVGGISFYLSNFLTPDLLRQIREIAAQEMPDMLVASLHEQGHINLKNDYTIYADNAHKLEPAEASKVLGEDNPDKQVVLIQGAVFVQRKEEDPVRTGTAEEILLIFDRGVQPPEISAKGRNVHVFDHNPPRFTASQDLMIEQATLPISSAGRFRPKFQDLPSLFEYRDNPASTEAMQERLQRFRQKVAGTTLGTEFLQALVQKGDATLSGSDAQVRVRLKGECRSDLEGRQPEILLRGNIRIERTSEGRTRTYWARQTDLVIQPSQTGMILRAVLRDGVRLLDPSETAEPVAQSSPFSVTLAMIPLEALMGREVPDSAAILDETVTMQIPETFQEERADLIQRVRNLRLQITAAIHARLAMSVSTLLLVTLATGLGIALRGGHALTAFGVAFIPTVVVVLMITTGQSLAEQAPTAILGLVVIWGILGLVAVLDGVVLLAGIRR